MAADVTPDDLLRELRRLSAGPEDVPTFVVPRGIDLALLVEWLRELPDGAGPEAVATALDALPAPGRSPWPQWVDGSAWFEREDFRAAFAPFHSSPEVIAEDFATPPRLVSHSLLALLALVSPAHAARVTAFRQEVREGWRAEGMSSEVLDTEAAHFTRRYRELAASLAQQPGYGGHDAPAT